MRARPWLARVYVAMNRLDDAADQVARCRQIMADAEDWRGYEECLMSIKEFYNTLRAPRTDHPSTRPTEEFRSSDDVLRFAASLERGSEHPLAGAIVAGAEERKLTLVSSENFKSVTGQGVTGRIEGRTLALGNQHMMSELGVAFGAVSADADAQRKDGHTVMFVAIDGRPAGLIGVADPIKASTAQALKMLQDDGVKIVVLTGDNRITAAAVAKKLGIDSVEAEVMPIRKQRW
jgi:P-type Cu+ transporter